MFGVPMYRIEQHKTVKRWKFPPTPFVKFDRADEENALRLGWSPWGGEVCEESVKVVISNAVLTKIDPVTGEIIFRAIAEIH